MHSHLQKTAGKEGFPELEKNNVLFLGWKEDPRVSPSVWDFILAEKRKKRLLREKKGPHRRSSEKGGKDLKVF